MIIDELQMLLCKTYQIQEDVNMIFDIIKNSEFYKKVVNLEYIPESDNEIVLKNSDNLNFKCQDCIKAQSKNPFILYLNVDGSSYGPKNINKMEGEIESNIKYSKIRIGILAGLYTIMVYDNGFKYNNNKKKWENGYNHKTYNSVQELISDLVPQKYAQYELMDYRIKGSIHHELIHWIDDTLHDNFITKKINNALKDQKSIKNSLHQKRIKVVYSPYEVNAMIGNIKELKNSMSIDEWDNLTLQGMLSLLPSYARIFKTEKSDQKIRFFKDITKRMYREGLFGKNMNNDLSELDL